jgi:hypothetical protein
MWRIFFSLVGRLAIAGAISDVAHALLKIAEGMSK